MNNPRKRNTKNSGEKNNLSKEGVRKPTLIHRIVNVISYIIPLILSFYMGFIFSDGFLNFQHSGMFHENPLPFNINQMTTFEYIGFGDITKNYRINGSYREEYFIVKNKWKELVHVKTQIIYDESRGLQINCMVKDTNETCDRYTIEESGRTKTLQLEINTLSIKKEDEYNNICFKTMEINNENNYFEECIEKIHIIKY